MKLARNLAFLAVFLMSVSPALAAAIGQSNQQVQAVANPILDSILTGFNDGNYDQYSKDFDAAMKRAIPAQTFSQTRDAILKKVGKYQSRTYLGYLKKGNITVVLWKGRFSASHDDILIELALSQQENKVKVSGLWFK